MMSQSPRLLLFLLAAGALMPVNLGAAPPGGPSAEDNYKTHCMVCHTATGDSPIAIMNFADGKWKKGSAVKNIAKVIANGMTSSAMMPFKDKLSESEILAIAKYVRAFDKRLK